MHGIQLCTFSIMRVIFHHKDDSLRSKDLLINYPQYRPWVSVISSSSALNSPMQFFKYTGILHAYTDFLIICINARSWILIHELLSPPLHSCTTFNKLQDCSIYPAISFLTTQHIISLNPAHLNCCRPLAQRRSPARVSRIKCQVSFYLESAFQNTQFQSSFAEMHRVNVYNAL